MLGRIANKTRIPAVCGVLLFLAPPLEGREAGSPHQWPGLAFRTASAADDELVVSESPMILLTPPSDRGGNSGWMKFETDPCGSLQDVKSNRSILRPSQFEDKGDDPEDEDPADQARELIGRWLSEHSEIAVVNDGIAQSCDGNWFEPEEFPPEFA